MDSYIYEVEIAADKLGLETEIKRRLGLMTLHATGEVDGQTVRVDATAQGYRDQTFVVMSSLMSPELDLGLHLKRNMLALGTGIAIAYPGFDAEHHVSADDADRAALLFDAAVCKKITAVADLGGDIVVNDARATIRQGLGFTELAPTLHALSRVTRALSERFAELPCASALHEAAPVWRAFAERQGFRFAESPFSLEGPLVSARSKRTGASAFVTDVTVRLEEPLDVGLAIRPARRLELLWEIFAGSDVQVGDAPFDRAFTIAARDPAVAAEVLDAEVRQLIMTLRKEGDVHLGEHGITLKTTHAADVPAAIELMRNILERAWQNARNRGKTGPYR